ncbi:hypothetical protein NEF87_003698 [Candidatus Lokiarchaeum ossiferum]|uniref:PCI domain-containing protein n=1 Tax=Candidatus Lokiarchaeum ossiferum TaxID=2951803 RepID=A0ABY6HV68_9ARCH|nr:hypothetical protein NEF87_003698 [Candidatus Lokiarchaeum sp. B-35]
MGTSEKYIEREAEKYGLARHPDKCNEKLRRSKGREFCLNCFTNDLKEAIETNFRTLQLRYGLNNVEIEITIEELLKRNQIKGFLDSKKQIFIFLTTEMEARLVSDLQSQGFVDLDQLQQNMSASTATTTRIMIELIRKNKLRGTFNHKKTRYYLEQGLTQLILQEIKTHGKVVHYDLAQKFEIPEGNVKNYIMNMMRNKIIVAFFADGGKITLSEQELESEIENFCLKNGIFMINALATHLQIAPELARRALFKLIQKGTIRGIFTQNHEFLTEEKLSEKIKAIARAYRTISIGDLAKKLAITEQRVEEGLATLISRGSINGYIDMAKRQFVADGKQPVTSFSSHAPHTSTNASATPQMPSKIGEVEVVRQYDFVGGQLHFKVVVRNKSNMAIHDIKVILDVPSSYRRARELITIPVIDPGNTHGVDFYLEPAECGISTIGGTVIYKDAMGKINTMNVNPKDVQIKCPLLIKSLDTIEDCQKAIQSLPSDARAFLIADLPPQMAYSAAHRAVGQFDVTNVASYEDDKSGNYEAEAWFSSEAKVTGGRVITRIYINGSSSTLEIRVWCNEAGQLTGLLAKMIELLFVEINMMRKIKSEERNKTMDVMAITRNLMEISNICLLRYRASSAKIKLEDTYSRLTRITSDDDQSVAKIYEWVKKLEEDVYEDEEAMLSDEDADSLDIDIQSIQQALHAQLSV